MTVTSGSYDVLAVCQGTDIMQLTISAVKVGNTEQTTIGSADVACGATSRIPIVLTGEGLHLAAKTDASSIISGGGELIAVIVCPEWIPTPMQFGR
ncbi:MAG: hypothetical protein H7248_07700 [Microbacteriaceae bacterium]|nr:hypothetical protein [Microbacteriaceae bacterium]